MKWPKIKTHKIDDGLYVAWRFCDEVAYGTTRRAAIKILKHDLRS